MANIYRTTKSITYMLKYHVVFCPRYRRKIFLVENVEERFKELAQEICDKLGVEIISIDCNVDHVHLIVECSPKITPADIVYNLKAYTGPRLISEIKEFHMMQNLWTRKYLISTEDILAQETIDSFVNSQKKRY